MRYALGVLGLVAAAWLAYANSFQAAFSLDSRAILLEDRIRAATAENLQLILRHTYWWPYGESGLYRPFATLSYLFNYAILGNGDRPEGYHEINFLLHAGNILVVYLLARRWWNPAWKAFATAGLWAVHPVLTEAVTNIAGRADLLAGLAVLSGLWMYLKSAESEGWSRWVWLGGLLLAAMVGVFSKENAVVLPGLIALWELTWRERKRWRSLALGWLAVSPALLAMAVCRAGVLSKLPALQIPFLDNPLAAQDFWSARLTAVGLLAKYLGLLVWPAHLSWDYSYAQIPVAHGSLADWAAWLVVGGICVAAVWACRSSRTVFFAIGWAFVTMLPTSNLAIPIGSILAERFLYLPAIGWAICLVAAIDGLAEKIGRPQWAPMVLSIAGVILAGRTFVRNGDWKDRVTIAAAGVETSPRSYKTHGALALAWFEADPEHGNLDRTIEEAERGLSILNGLPEEKLNADAFLQAADYYRAKGNSMAAEGSDRNLLTAEGRESYRRELELLMRSHTILDVRYRRSVALEQARNAPAPTPDNTRFVELEDAIAAAHLRLGDAAAGVAAAEMAVERAPQTPESYALLAAGLLVSEKADEAAVTLFEGIFATGNAGLRGKLESLYGNMPGESCALVSGPSGPKINPSCGMVRRQACVAIARLIPIYRKNGRQDLIGHLEERVGPAFGCK